MHTQDTSIKKSRTLAAEIIGQWLQTEEFPDRLIPADIPDRAFTVELVYGVAKRKRTLEWLVSRLADRPPDPDVLPFLFVGLYQLFFMDSVPAHAAVDETVEAVKSGPASAVSFVNGILRESLRRKPALLASLEKEDVGVRESHPEVLVQRWKRQYGDVPTRRLCAWDNTTPEVVLHINRLQTTLAAFQEQLAAANINAAPHPARPSDCLILPRGIRVEAVPGYNEGAFTVQDPSTLLSIDLLAPQPGEHVLDACAAPGGKLALIAERMNGQGSIVAMDLYEDRLERLKQNIERLALKNVTVIRGNATTEANMNKVLGTQLFDRILLDVPCSNTGVLRRRADARWRFSLRRLANHADVQRLMLGNALLHLKSTGTLVYSTCSLDIDENENLVNAWLAKHPEWECTETLRSLPPDSGMDGAFAAKIQQRV
jgi:16S rRNA (cytosine967-C5)-methyltransferase